MNEKEAFFLYLGLIPKIEIEVPPPNPHLQRLRKRIKKSVPASFQKWSKYLSFMNLCLTYVILALINNKCISKIMVDLFLEYISIKYVWRLLVCPIRLKIVQFLLD